MMSEALAQDFQFREAMVEAGIAGVPGIIADGCIHRFDVDGDKRGSRNGWYVLHSNSNEISAGAFGNWKTAQKEKWCSRMPDRITDDERQALKRHIQQAQKQVEKQLKASQAAAAKKARTTWSWPARAAAPDHPYLTRKHIQPHGIRQEKDRLVIPVRDAKGELKSLQFIGPDGTKRFLIGGAVQGNYHVIGELQEEIYIGEGFATMATIYEATGCGAVVAFNAGNLELVAKGVRKQYPNANITIVADNDQWTEGNPGVANAKTAAEAIHAKLVIPQFTNLDTKPTDFNDLYCLEGLDTVKKQLTEALSMDGKEQPCAESPGEAIARLAALSSLEYGLQRKSASEDLEVPLKFLDQAVTEARTASGTNKKPGQGSEITFDEIFPSEEPVDGAALVQSLTTIIKRFMVLPPGAALTIALWILRTFIFDSFGINPILSIRSPVMQCGKTTLINLIAMFVPKAQATSNTTPASVFRLIEKYHPTLLMDEMDSFKDSHVEFRGILNSCHNKRTAKVIRNVGDDHEPREFSTWTPVVLAAIGRIYDTVDDRSLRIDLQKKAEDEGAEDYPQQGDSYTALEAATTRIRSQCLRWTHDNLDVIVNARVQKLGGLSSRANDNWHSLLAVASVVGAQCLEDAVTAARAISSLGTEDPTAKTLLLFDVKDLFQNRGVDKMSSQDLCDELAALEERPWAVWRKGKPITTNQLAWLLRDFGVLSQTIRFSSTNTSRGYYKDNFEKAWGRYCVVGPREGDLKRHNDTTCMDKGQTPDFQGETEGLCVTLENGTLANADAGCVSVSLQNQESGGEGIQKGEQANMFTERNEVHEEVVTDVD